MRIAIVLMILLAGCAAGAGIGAERPAAAVEPSSFVLGTGTSEIAQSWHPTKPLDETLSQSGITNDAYGLRFTLAKTAPGRSGGHLTSNSGRACSALMRSGFWRARETASG